MAEYAASTASSTSTGKDALESGNPMRGKLRRPTLQYSPSTRRRDFDLALRRFGRDDGDIDASDRPTGDRVDDSNEGHWQHQGTLRRLGDLVQAGRLLSGRSLGGAPGSSGREDLISPVGSAGRGHSKHVLRALDEFYHTDRESIMRERRIAGGLASPSRQASRRGF